MIVYAVPLLPKMTKKAAHIEKGKVGEQLAAEYLTGKGYRIVVQNFRAGKGEIDLIGWWGDKLLVFFEVKTRNDDSFGGPEEAITVKKQKLLINTAGVYMEQIGYDWEVRFDVVAIILKKSTVVEIRHHEDAFFWY
jgi:putative endonuclease